MAQEADGTSEMSYELSLPSYFIYANNNVFESFINVLLLSLDRQALETELHCLSFKHKTQERDRSGLPAERMSRFRVVCEKGQLIWKPE